MNCLWRRFRSPIVLLRLVKTDIATKTLHFSVYEKNLNTTSTLLDLHNKNVYYSAIRCKSKKAQHDSDDEEEEFNDDASLTRDSKVLKFNTTSLRTDLILKSALNIARNKIEQQFYESKIRVNGKKIMKKSATVRLGDEIDIIKMVSPNNPQHLYVTRVEILNMTAKEDAIAVTARRYKSLLIENYEEDPYKGNAETES